MKTKKLKHSINEFVYDSWIDAVTDCIADGMADNRTEPCGGNSFVPDVILEDDFGDVEKKTIKYLKGVPGLYIFYFRPKKLVRSFLKLFKKESE